MASSSNTDPQKMDIPKILHFVWMGKKNIPPITDTFKDGDGKFRSATVVSNATVNNDCRAFMWVDVFTMMPDYLLEKVLSAQQGLWDKYSSWADLATRPTAVERKIRDKDEDGKDIQFDVRDPFRFIHIAGMLRSARKVFGQWLRDDSNAQYVMGISPLKDLCDLCGHNIQVRFLDRDKYLDWMDSTAMDPQYVNWLFFELYMRGKNFGSAGDLLRTQILLDEGGMYVDHDDKLVKMHDILDGYKGLKYSVVEEDDNDPVKGPFKALEPTTGYLAAPRGHPFLQFFQDGMLQTYAYLLNNNYVWHNQTRTERLFGEKYTIEGNRNWFEYRRGKDRVTGEWLEFASFSIEATGPGQLRRCRNFVKDQIAATKALQPSQVEIYKKTCIQFLTAGHLQYQPKVDTRGIYVLDFGKGFPEGTEETRVGVAFSNSWVNT